MNKPLVSICMSAYNAEKYISSAIRSVINQSYQHWELIIVNDGSKDETSTIIESFADKRIKFLNQENKGQSASANKAFEYSQGELIKFFDADDILSVDFIKNQVTRLNGNLENVVSAAWGRFYNDNINTFKLNPQTVWKDMQTDEWLTESFINGQPMMQCALWLIPRPILLKSGLWNENLSLINDFDFFTRVLLNSKMVLFEQKAILYYRSGIIDSLSSTKTRKGIESAYYSIEEAVNNLLNKRNDKRTSLSCANIWQQFIFDTYPYYPDLREKAMIHLSNLERSSLSFPCGGYSKLLLPLFGWKLIKRMQIHKHNLTYSRIRFKPLRIFIKIHLQ
ncbi:glycosyltransferase family 2 protein [Mucilaginibacter sp. SP1R1]|uniref:glycosyltransferase family 2 protein n=1 Tax=Mucilaginibacter sp. SP1R1 TaxID=2723091 RepID=UPI00161C1CF1|nr:glycosyltransferase [Mucilaginibacter sp. SP1R1]MBB6150993.1 glycosyltransferase involved in cell wall biosynthesis [Mucilaginibacter sp. SP1R1]